MNLLHRLKHWFSRKSAALVAGNPWTGPATLDAFRRVRAPSSGELLHELKNTTWTCASVNAAVCTSFPPRLYVATGRHQPEPRCQTRNLSPETIGRLKATPHLDRFTRKAEQLAEVVDHPLLDLLRQVNETHNGFDLFELTELFLEIHGTAYWLLEIDPVLNIPAAIWILPSQHVAPKREANSSRLVDYYEYRGQRTERLPAGRVIQFRFPDPRDPYGGGLSPLRACFEQAALASDYAALKRALYDNTALPGVVLTPAEAIGTEERDRLEEQWRRKFKQGGRGQVLVAESSFSVSLLSQSLGDLALLADLKATKEDIANAFGVPLPFLSGDTNLANLQAADHLHKTLAITPRLKRRDEKLNEQLIPWYDPTGRLFLASDDPTPANQAFVLQQEQADLKQGVRTINEVRASRGLAPVPWGDQPRLQ